MKIEKGEAMTKNKKNPKNEENLILDTAGGEMPNPKRRFRQKASDAASAFEVEPLKKASAHQAAKKKAG
jgi:hypothetical protein